MIPTFKFVFLFLLVSVQNRICLTNSEDFQTDVNSFIKTFDEVYSTENNEPVTNIVDIGNEMPVDPSVVEEEPKQNEVPPTPVSEPAVVSETVFPLGGEITHDVTDEVRSYAASVLQTISAQTGQPLRLIDVIKAVTTVTNKVQRTLSLVVGRQGCDEASCGVSCSVELVSLSHGDHVTGQTCVDTNEIMRVKRGAIGGFKVVDDKEARELATLSMSVLDSLDADDYKRVVRKVIRAQKQLVNGILYHLTVEVSSTQCKEDEAECDGPPIDLSVCKILMQRMFSGEVPDKAQVIKSECTPISDSHLVNVKRGKRDVSSYGNEINSITNDITPKKKKTHRLMGAPTNQDPDSENIREISEFARSQIDKASNSLNKQKIVRVVEARSQVVAGVKYFLKLELVETNCRKDSDSDQTNCSPINSKVLQECDVVIWDKPWMKFRAMTSSNCQTVHQREKRAVVGGKKPADVNSYNIHKIAQYAVEQLDAKSNSLNAQKLIVVKQAETQTVAGTNYFLKLQLVETKCRKGTTSKSQCEPAPNSVVQECDIVIYDRPWDRHREMTSSECHAAPTTPAPTTRKERAVPGGLSPADPNDNRVKEMANFAVSTLDAGSNSLNQQKLVTVKEVKTQVVAGKNYYIKLQLVETTCRKGATNKEQCNAAPGSMVQECDVVVYDRPWDKHREMTKSDCHAVTNSRKKRDILVGGLSPADPNDDRVKEMANFAVFALDARSNSLNQQKLVTVKEVKTQVVAGANYYIKLQLVETTCRKGAATNAQCNAAPGSVVQECDVVVYDRPWDKHPELTSAKCSPAPSADAKHTARNRRDVKTHQRTGGRVDMDKSSTKVRELAHQAVRDVNRQSNSLYRHALQEVVSAQSQVVSGVKYFLTVVVAQTECRNNGREDDSSDTSECQAPANAPTMLCDYMIYERPWENAMSSSFNCSSSRTTHSRLTHTSHLNQQRTGVRVDMDKSSIKVRELAHQAVRDVNRQSNSLYRHTLQEVVSAQSQVVSGVKYFLTVVVAQTECRNNGREDDSSDTSECQAPANAPTMLCDYMFYEKAGESGMYSSFNCSSSRTTHSRLTQTSQLNQQRTGGRVDMDKSSTKVRELAHQAVRDVNRQSNSLYRHALQEVVSAQSQLVSGVKYFLTVVVAQTECRNNGREDESSDTSECQVAANAPTMLCEYVVYERPWEHSVSSSFNCSGTRSTHSRLTQTSQSQLEEVMPGAPIELDKDSTKVRELASKAVRDVNMRLNSPYRQTLLQVISARSQVVNGVKYYLKIALAQTECYKNRHDSSECQPNADAALRGQQEAGMPSSRLPSSRTTHSAASFKPTMLCDYVFYQQPSESVVSHSYNCSDAPSGWRPGSHHHFISPDAGHGPMPGAPVDMDKSSTKVRELVHQAVRDVNRQLKSPYRQALLDIVSAQSQMVNGVRYYLKVALAQTDCRYDGQDSADSTECHASADAPTMLCNFMFYEELGQNSVSRSSFNCSRPLTMSSQYTASETTTYHQQEATPTNCYGCVKHEDVNLETVQANARRIVKDVIDKKSNSPYRHKLVEVISAQSQVVSGFKAWLTIKIVESSCVKGSNVDIDLCSPRENGPEKVCEVTSYLVPDGGEETSFSCSSHITRTTHSHSQQMRLANSQGDVMVGSRVNMDKSSTKVRELAHQAVRDVNRQSNSLYRHNLQEVVSAQSQVVSGVKYFLTVVLAQTECRNNGREDDSSDTFECQAPANAPTMTCDFVLYERPGQSYMYSSSFNCSRPLTMSSRYSASETTTYQHQQAPVVQCDDCATMTDDDVRSYSVQTSARDFVRNLIDKKSDSLFRYKLLEVVSAKSQGVPNTKSWMKIRIIETSCRKDSTEDISECMPKENSPVQECEVQSSVRSDGGRQSSFSCSSHSHSTYTTHSDCENSQSHETIPLPGGLSPRDPNEDEVQSIARFALSELDASSNSLNQQKLLQVKQAQSQVVAGTQYYLKLRLVETNCRKGHQSASECSAAPGSVVQECDVVVYDRPWDNHREMTSSRCRDISQHAEKKTPGKWENIARTDRKVKEAAIFSLKTIDSRNNQYYKSALINIVDSKVQYGAGNKYKLLVEVGESSCSKYQKEENCPLREDNPLKYKCDVIVWDRPWLDKMEVLSCECNVRGRRSLKSEADSLKADHLRMFEDFKTRYNKTYENEVEHKKRFRIFRANMKKIDSLQANEQGTAIYGPNMFADLSEKEFKQRYLGLKRGPTPQPGSNHMRPALIPDVELPTDFDWRDHGAVTPVKNQGQCGSCWAFSVTGNVEGQWFLKHGKLVSLSEQELVDCDKSDSGCNGGYMTVAYEAIEKLGGLETEDEYPYDAHDETCHFNKSLAAATVAGSLNITTNETQIAQWLFKNGPISIGINANAMQFYMGGVSHPFKFLCNRKELDHGVLLVGFGVHRTSIRHKLLPYWLVKNSWGPHWGEKGYYRVYRGDGTCGVNQMASSAVVD